MYMEKITDYIYIQYILFIYIPDDFLLTYVHRGQGHPSLVCSFFGVLMVLVVLVSGVRGGDEGLPGGWCCGDGGGNVLLSACTPSLFAWHTYNTQIHVHHMSPAVEGKRERGVEFTI